MDMVPGPGKFEGEPTFVPHFYDVMLDGASDVSMFDGDTPVEIFIVDADDVRKFPDLEGTYAVAIWESEQGFVYHQALATMTEYEQLMADLESEEIDEINEEG